MTILLSGATGRMGRAVQTLVSSRSEYADVKIIPLPDAERYIFKNQTFSEYKIDVLMDFSNHCTTTYILEICQRYQIPAVIGTTGQTVKEKREITRAASQIPIILSANFSRGITMLLSAAARLAILYPNADTVITESHHRYKSDAPSGTALLLRDTVVKARESVGIHAVSPVIHSLRYGTICGVHEILFADQSETIVLRHTAESRDLYAEGALAAARFIIGKPPRLYNEIDLSEL